MIIENSLDSGSMAGSGGQLTSFNISMEELNFFWEQISRAPAMSHDPK